ncbi:MAG: hypothetical protein ACOY46_03165 [Bacillota bacterium]
MQIKLPLLAFIFIIVMTGCAATGDKPGTQEKPNAPLLTIEGKERIGRPQVAGSRLLLPAGPIHEAGWTSFGSRSSSPVKEPDLVRGIISLLEKGEVLKGFTPYKYSGVSFQLVYDEDRSVTVYSTVDGQTVEVHFGGYEWINEDTLQVKSPELAGTINRLAGWSFFSAAGIPEVSKISFKNKKGSFTTEDASQIEAVVSGLRKAGYISPSKCPFDTNQLELYSRDRIIHGIVAGDGCPTILLEGNEYQVDEAAYAALRKLVEANGLSLVPDHQQP